MSVTLGDLRIYTVEELADKLKVSPRTIYDYIHAGKLRATRFGKKYQITQESLEKYFNEPSVSTMIP